MCDRLGALEYHEPSGPVAPSMYEAVTCSNKMMILCPRGDLNPHAR